MRCDSTGGSCALAVPGGQVHRPGHRCRLDLLLRDHRCQRCWGDYGRVVALAARRLWHIAQPIAVPKSVAVTLTIRAAVAADRPRTTDLDFLGLVERQHHDPRLRRNGRPGHRHRAALVLEMQFAVAWSVERQSATGPSAVVLSTTLSAGTYIYRVSGGRCSFTLV